MISAHSLTNLRARWIAAFTSTVPSSVNESSFRFTMPITKGRRGNTICLCLARRIIGREPHVLVGYLQGYVEPVTTFKSQNAAIANLCREFASQIEACS